MNEFFIQNKFLLFYVNNNVPFIKQGKNMYIIKYLLFKDNLSLIQYYKEMCGSPKNNNY